MKSTSHKRKEISHIKFCIQFIRHKLIRMWVQMKNGGGLPMMVEVSCRVKNVTNANLPDLQTLYGFEFDP